jgi:hypothetical protein
MFRLIIMDIHHPGLDLRQSWPWVYIVPTIITMGVIMGAVMVEEIQ